MEKGYFGLYPPDTNIGDQVCIILRAQTPLQLRNLGLPNTWELVGERYVHRLMDGEALEHWGMWRP
jgi:hypothetical protein